MTPVYKLRSNGDQVMVGDQVYFSSTTVQLFLHASPFKLQDDEESFEVNAASQMTPWKVNLFLEYHPNADKVLKGGDVIRLYHAEQEKVHSIWKGSARY